MTGTARTVLAFLLPPLSWFLSQQGLSLLLRARCAPGGSWHGPATAIMLILAMAAAGLAAPLFLRPAAPALARGAMLLWTGIFALALLYQGMAALLLPACAL